MDKEYRAGDSSTNPLWPRSPLRDGTALDGLVPGRPLENSLLDRAHLQKIEPPVEPSLDFTRWRGFQRPLAKGAAMVKRCETFELASVCRDVIAELHQPRAKEIGNRKLPSHIPCDPIDPVEIFLQAIPLVYRVLHEDAAGQDGLDLDGVAYIIERLAEADGLRTEQDDLRFDVLRTLSGFLQAVIDKSEEECWACLESA